MQSDIYGIVLRQIKIAGGRRMIHIFSRERGKISVGTNISENSKSKSALSIRPFTYGLYNLEIKQSGFISIRTAETIEPHFQIGENPERFIEASYVFEFTDKLLPEEMKASKIFDLLLLYLSLLCKRKDNFRLLTISYMIKIFQIMGVFPESNSFSDDKLLSTLNFDIFNTLVYLTDNPLEKMGELTLNSEKTETVFVLLKEFASVHLDIGPLKSDILMNY